MSIYLDNAATTKPCREAVKVEEDLSDRVQFSLGISYNSIANNYVGIPIYITGSPRDLLNDNPTRLFSGEGNIMDRIPMINTNSNTDVLYYDIDTGGGQSGAPVYTITKIGNEYIYTAIAIHYGGASASETTSENNLQNWGSMITNYHLQFYNNNPNINYSVD